MSLVRFVPLLLLPLIGACAIPGDAAWSDLHSTLQAGATQMTGMGNFEQTSSATLAEPIDLPKKEDSNRYFAGRFGFAPVELIFSTFSYTGHHFDNSVDLVAGLTTTATTDINLSAQKLLIGFDMVNLPVARAGVLVGMNLLDFEKFQVDVPLEDPKDYSANVPVPLLGLRGDVRLLGTGLRIGGEICGTYLTNLDTFTKIKHLDWDVNLSWSRGSWTEWNFGYRHLGLNVEGLISDEDISADLEFSGPYLTFGVVW